MNLLTLLINYYPAGLQQGNAARMQHVTRMTAPLVLRAPAKLNLTLEVLQRRADGLHGLRSLMVPVDLADELTVVPSGEGFAFTCDDPALARENLVERAVRALDLPDPNIAIALRKVIPTGAGMGGGSSDAAAVLIAAQRGALGDLGRRDYMAIARSLGSDVPFFLAQTGALVEGTGERVTAVGALEPWHAVIVRPPVAISTAAAYAALDAHERPTRSRNTSVTLEALTALQRGEFDRVVELMHNDFEPVIAAMAPEIAQALEALRSAGAVRPLLTGSGSCVFALARDAARAEELASRITLPAQYIIYRVAFATGSAWRSPAWA